MDSEIENSIKQIKILIRTNIIGDNNFIILTKNMLVISDSSKLTDYPYFSEKFLYPTRILNTYTYEQKIDFFFNLNSFKKLIYANKKVENYNNYSCKIEDFTINTDDSDDDSEKEDSKVEDDEYVEDDEEYDKNDDFKNNKDNDKYGINKINIMKTNIETMIAMLFPTTFPAISENINSFCQYIRKEPQSIITLKGSLPDSIADIIDPSLKPEYSYLNIAGSIHTITKTIWLNDLLNHPKYVKLIDDFTKLKIFIKDIQENYGFNKNIESYGKIIKGIISDTKIKKMIINNEKILDNSVTNKNMYYPVNYNNDNDDMLKKFKSNVKKLFGYSTDNKMTRTISFSVSKKSKRKKNKGPFQIITGGEGINNSNIDTDTDIDTDIDIDIDIDRIKKNTYKNTNNYNKPEFNLEKTIRLINIIYASIESNPQFRFNEKTPLTNIFKKLLDFSGKITELKYIRNNYFNKNPNLSFNSDTNISNDFKTGRFKQYNDYIVNLELYNDTNLKCYNKILQLAINNYIRNIDLYLNDYLEYSSNLLFYNKKTQFPYSDGYFSINEFKDSKFPHFIGITSSDKSDPKYELYLQIDLIKGKLTNENIKLLSCNYKNTELGGILTSKFDNMNMVNSNVVQLNKTYQEIPNDVDIKLKKKEILVNGGKNKKKTQKRFNKRLYYKTKKNK